MRLVNQHTTYKVYSFLFMALVLVLPIHGKLVPPVIALIGLNWLLEFNFAEKLRQMRSHKAGAYLMGFSLLYLLYMIGTLYSSRINAHDGALFNLETKLSLLVFPLLFSTINFDLLPRNFRNKILKAFITGCTISMLLLLNNAVFSYLKSDNTHAFYYVDFAFVHHPSYLALYFTFAIAVLLDWLLTNRPGNTLKRNMAYLMILSLQLYVVLLSSKAGIIAVGLIYISAIVYFLLKRSRPVKSVVTLLLLVSFAGTLFLFPTSYSRFFRAETALKTAPSPNTDESSGTRVLVWQVSLELIKKHPVFGVGTGDVEPELMKLYEERGIKLAMDESLNTHNQYLQTYLATGIAGFLFLLAIFALPAYFAFRQGQLLYLLFILMFSFNLLVESMLERQAGVVFYAFFNSFLFYYTYQQSRRSDA